MALPEAPNSRSEQYLAKIAGQDVTLPEAPNSRVEQYLDYIVEHGTVSKEEIAEQVSDWLEENIHEDPTVVIDSSLSVSGAAADAKATGDVTSTLSSSLSKIVTSEAVETPIDWTDVATTNYPYGWMPGYYHKDTGEAISSNLYCRTVNSYFFQKEGCNLLRATAPSGYYISAFEYASDGSFIKRIGDSNSANANPSNELIVSFDPGHKFKFVLGKFSTGGTDVNNHISDQTFLNKAVVVFSTVSKSEFVKPASLSYTYNETLQSAIKLPTSYTTSGSKVPMIVFCHGASSSLDSTGWGTSDVTTLLNKFADDGFAVLDVNKVTDSDWCNPALIERYAKAIAYAERQYNVTASIIYAQSMGSLIGLKLASMVKSVKVCVVGGIRLDFAARYAQLSVSDKEAVDANLGFTDGYDAFIAAGYDIGAYSVDLGNDVKLCPVQFPPVLFVIGSDDTLTKTESLAKIDEIKRGGTICKSVEYSGSHNDACFLKPTGSYGEAIAWIRKWI